MSEKTFVVGFDTAHKPRGKISSNYSELARLLNSNGFNCVEYEEYPISKKTLNPLDILAIICPDNSKLSKEEIDAIKSWVWKDGGGLLLVNHAGGDKGRRSNLNFLGQQFGISFENDQLLDVDNNIGVENLPVVDMFPLPHPINDEINEICFRAGCTLVSSRGDVMASVTSGGSSEPAECPLVLSGEDGDGMVVAVGSYEMFRDKTNGGLDFEDNSKLILNIFNHLKTEKRASTTLQDIAAEEAARQAPATSGQGVPVHAASSIYGAGVSIPVQTYESHIKIQSSDELYTAFENQLTALFNFKATIIQECDNLITNTKNMIQAIVASKEDISNIEQAKEIIEARPVTVSEGGEGEGGEEEDDGIYIVDQSRLEQTHGTADINSGGKGTTQPALSNIMANLEQLEKNKVNELSPPPGAEEVMDEKVGDLPSLSLMPRRPDGTTSVKADLKPAHVPKFLEEEAEEVKIPETPKKGAVVDDTSTDVKNLSKDELEEELEILKKKLKSVENMYEFVQRKFDSGKMAKNAFTKQVKNLDNDKNKANFRIEEIESRLTKI